MRFAHIGKIKEVSNVIDANQLIETGAELLAIVPGWTSDNTPCTLFYLGYPKPKPDSPPEQDSLGVMRPARMRK